MAIHLLFCLSHIGLTNTSRLTAEPHCYAITDSSAQLKLITSHAGCSRVRLITLEISMIDQGVHITTRRLLITHGKFSQAGTVRTHRGIGIRGHCPSGIQCYECHCTSHSQSCQHTHTAEILIVTSSFLPILTLTT